MIENYTGLSCCSPHFPSDVILEEVAELNEQLADVGKSVHELQKAKKKMEMEKEELQASLEESEAALEVLRKQVCGLYTHSCTVLGSS